MAHTTGTATDYHDLLDKLRLWLVGTAGWTQLRWVPPTDIFDTAELWVRGPGAGTDRQVFVGMQSANDPGANAYGWRCRCATSFDSGADFANQPSTSPNVYMNTWQNSIEYWIYANDRRFVLVAKCSTSYPALYGGFFLPFALPNEYPFPLYIGASFNELAPVELDNAGNRSFADPGDGAAYYRTRSTLVWHKVSNHNRATAENANPEGGAERTTMTWPFSVPRASNSGSRDKDWNMFCNQHRFRPNVNGELPIFQVHLYDPEDNVFVGALDAVFMAPGFNRATEQSLSAGGRDFRLFQNIFRSTPRDFWAIEEI